MHERKLRSPDPFRIDRSRSRCGSRGLMASEQQRSDQEDLRYRVLRELEKDPRLSQRDLAARLNNSLGAINYCLRALAEKGLVKIDNFRASDNRLRYAYVLTPSGLAQKAALTRRFLDRKMREYEELQREIAQVRAEIGKDAGVEAETGTGPASGGAA